MFFALLALVAHHATRALMAQAQGTSVVCLEEFDWMTNSEGQNPCLVTAWLLTPCYGLGNESFISPLPPGASYEETPHMDTYDPTPCDCNTVLYSTFAACGICQNGGIDPWPIYSAKCTNVYIGSFPERIPGGTAIPAWAFLDVVTNSELNISAARVLAAQHLAADTTSASTSAATSNTPSTTASVTTTPIPAQSSTTSGFSFPTGFSGSGRGPHSRNLGPIVGGSIGAVLGFSAVCVLIVLLVVRFQRRRRPGCPDEIALDTHATAISNFLMIRPAPKNPSTFVRSNADERRTHRVALNAETV